MGNVLSAVESVVEIVKGAVVVVAMVASFFQSPPSRPAPMPEVPGKSKEQLRREARQALGIDSVNHFNFGFSGITGSGKSSLINAVLGQDAAFVDQKEATQKIQAFTHPKYRHIKLWDIPGCATSRHPAATYFQDKKLYAFDMLFIISSERLREPDIGIAQAAAKMNTPFAFIRNKSDEEMGNIMRKLRREGVTITDDVLTAKKKEYREEKVVADIKAQLPAALKDSKIFVVSAHILGGDDDVKKYAIDEAALIKHVLDTAMARRG